MQRRTLSSKRGKPHGAEWDAAARWYRAHLQEEGTLLREVVYPRALRLLGEVRGRRILDVACGEGTFAQVLSRAGATVVGIDVAPAFIRVATGKKIPNAEFHVADARTIGQSDFSPFTAATMLLAIQNMNREDVVFQNVAHVLTPRAPFVLVLTHPCFRIPRQSGWGWDEQRKLQYRRVDRYLTPLDIPVQVRPGAAPSITTRTFHRPLSTYVTALASAGFAITALEEWSSDRASTSGPRARAENLARKEIPVFLAIRTERR